jgi:hypothetical protein
MSELSREKREKPIHLFRGRHIIPGQDLAPSPCMGDNYSPSLYIETSRLFLQCLVILVKNIERYQDITQKCPNFLKLR